MVHQISARQRGSVSVVAIVLAAILIGYGLYSHQKKKAEKVAELASMPDAGYGWNLYTLDGRTIPFSTFKGKTIFLNFWGTWCGPCLYEMPAIQRMYDKVKDQGVEVVLISSEDIGTLSNFMASQHYTFPVYRFEPPIPVTTVELAGMPATLIIAPNGKIARVHVDPDAWDSEANIQFILSLAKKWPAPKV